MSFLPIVQRELRVAARRKSTYRIRSWTAVVAMAASFLLFVFLSLGRGRGTIGSPLFTVLSGYAFGLSLLAGVFLTTDCLSEEKREGTLGLLFLTDLKGYDVVLGKFMAQSLNAFYGLFALLPVMALPLLLGGVTVGEFWRMAAALVNALFISLAAGICVSAFMRNAQPAMGSTLGLLALLAAGLPALDRLSSFLSAPWLHVAWISPLTPFLEAREVLYPGQAGRFWRALVASHLLGWCFLGLASYVLPWRWRSEASEGGSGLLGRLLRRGGGSAAEQRLRRTQLLPINPVFWLMSGELGIRRLAWGLVALWGAVALPMMLIFGWGSESVLLMVGFCARPFGFLLKALVAVQACRFFAEGRRNGSLEVLLGTGLTNREIIRGQGLALRRNFLGPGLTFIGLVFGPMLIRAAVGMLRLDLDQWFMGISGLAVTGIYCLQTVADIFAVCWFGMWLGLAGRHPKHAPALTILLVLIVPSLVCCEFYPPFSMCGLGMLADLFFILWGSSRLREDLRGVLARQYERTTAPSSMPVPPVLLPAPPILGSR